MPKDLSAVTAKKPAAPSTAALAKNHNNNPPPTASGSSSGGGDDGFPRPLILSADDEALLDNLNAFRGQWTNYARAFGVNNWPADRQRATLLAAIGPDFAQDWRRLEPTLSHSDRSSAGALLAVIGRHLLGDQKRLRRYQFGKQARYDGEPYLPYLKRLQLHIDGCQYGALRDDVLLDKIIASANDDELSADLCSMEELTLERALDWCLRKAQPPFEERQRKYLVKSLMAPAARKATTTHEMMGDKLSMQSAANPLSKKQQRKNAAKAEKQKLQPRATAGNSNQEPDVPVLPSTASSASVESTSGSGGGGGGDLFELPCERCGDQRRGEDHLFSPTLCPAHGHTCTKCGGSNHSELVCDQSS